MGTITLTFVHGTLGTLTRTKTLADADLVRLLSMAREKYKNNTDPAGPLSNAVAYDRLFDAAWGGWRTQTRDFEADTAKKAAEAGVTPIEGSG